MFFSTRTVFAAVRFLICAMVPMLFTSTVVAQPRYLVSRVFSPPGGAEYANAWALNSAGAAAGGVGNSIGMPPARGAFWNADGSATYLATAGESVLTGLNNGGIACGTMTSGDISTGFLFTNGTVTPLSSPGGGSAATSINDGGIVVGYAYHDGGNFTPAFWTGAMTRIDVPTLGGATGQFNHVNNDGITTGLSRNAAGQLRAFRYNIGTQVMEELGTFGGPNSIGRDITSAGLIYGSANNTASETVFRAALFNSDGSLTNLGIVTNYLSSAAYAGLDSGMAVGESSTLFSSVATLFDIDDAGDRRATELLSLVDNPLSGMIFHRATDINDQGQIAVTGALNGLPVSYLLTPVPSPGTFALLAIAGVSAARWRRAPVRL